MTYISFNTKSGSKKPNTLTNKDFKCPFCSREDLRKDGRIIRETPDFLIVRNKFPVMKDTFPTVLIEHSTCDEHIGTYSLDYLTKLLEFSLSYYDELMKSRDFKSVVFFKNHGLFSGGSIKHPHMQILGLYNDTYLENIQATDFEGVPILSNKIIDWNISTKPRTEFYEINLILKDKEKNLDVLANHLQKSVNFTLNELNPKYQCYNLAFHIESNSIKVKLISRAPNSVLLLGFGIHQVPDNLEERAKQLKDY